MKKKLDCELFDGFSPEVYNALEIIQEILNNYDNLDAIEMNNKLFRSFHSLKGACSFLELENICKLAHKLENLLSVIRENKSKIPLFVREHLLLCCEHINIIFREISQTGEHSSFDLLPLIENTEKMEQQNILEENTPQIKTKDKNNLKNTNQQTQYIRVSVEEVENLLRLSSELTLLKNKLISKIDALSFDSVLTATVRSLVTVTSQIQQSGMRFRLQKVETLFKTIPGIVNELTKRLDKKVNIEISGESAELDKSIVEIIKEPIIHMIRNSLDHGIESPALRSQNGKPETGLLKLEAYNTAGWFILEISDDGNGINLEKVKKKALEKGLISEEKFSTMDKSEAYALIFEPGLSTNDEISDLSGRGVGMDAVKSTIERCGGRIEIQSELLVGTTFKLFIPLTLAVVPSLIFQSMGINFAISRNDVRYVFKNIEHKKSHNLKEQSNGFYFEIQDGSHIPVSFLNECMGTEMKEKKGDAIYISHQNYDFILIVDSIQDFEDLVVKPINSLFIQKPIYSGVSVLADGRVVYGLNPMELIATHRITEKEVNPSKLSLKNHKHLENQYLTFEAAQGVSFSAELSKIVSIHKADTTNLKHINDESFFLFREKYIDTIDLGKLIGTDSHLKDGGCIVVLQENHEYKALIVEKIKGTYLSKSTIENIKNKKHVKAICEFNKTLTYILDTGSFYSMNTVGTQREVLKEAA